MSQHSIPVRRRSLVQLVQQLLVPWTLAGVACGGSAPAVDVATDGGGGDGALIAASDANATVPPAPSPNTALLAAAVTQLSLPQSATEYALDVDGDGTPDNALGAALQGTAPLTGFLSKPKGGGSGSGDAPPPALLFELFADSLTDTSSARLTAQLGQAAGEGSYTRKAGSTPYELPAKISAGRMDAGPARVVLTGLIGGVTITVERARIQGDVSAAGVTAGVIAGVIPQSEINGQVVPALASGLNALLTSDKTNLLIKQQLRALDGNKNGTIEAQELLANPLFANLVKLDVDVNGDGTADALSFGVGFTASRALLRN